LLTCWRPKIVLLSLRTHDRQVGADWIDTNSGGLE
jgi:hypothetical protein